jgi:predicted TIM-barrel fold metal-dependent hydrolase
MERVVKELHSPAISVLAAYGSRGQPLRFLDHPDFWPVLALAAELRVPLFVHASGRFRLTDAGEPPLSDLAATYLHGGLSMLLENTLCLARLALSGVFDRFPELRIVVGQLGGLFPFILGRFDLIYDLVVAAAQTGTEAEPPTSARAQGVLRRLRDYSEHIYVDIHSMEHAAILCALEVLGCDRVLYGSDFPVTPEALGRQAGLETIRSLPVSPATQAAILGGTAADLLSLERETARDTAYRTLPLPSRRNTGAY